MTPKPQIKKDCPNRDPAETDQRTCFTCGQPGHISARCPQGPATNGGSGGEHQQHQRAPRAAKSSEPKTCYNCGGPHLQRECPEPRKDEGNTAQGGGGSGRKPRGPRNNAGGASGGGASGGGAARTQPRQPRAEGEAPKRSSRGIKCYNCGDLGHISRECPSAEMGPRCYRCNKFGHVSSACQEVPDEAGA